MAAPKVILQLYPVIPAEGETADEQFEYRKKNRPVGANIVGDLSACIED